METQFCYQVGFTWLWAFLPLTELSDHTVQRAGAKRVDLTFFGLSEKTADEAEMSPANLQNAWNNPSWGETTFGP